MPSRPRATRRELTRPRTAIAVAWVCALASGCAGKIGSVPNPFTSADRVPPPATRAIAPGTAMPYYPNDPLPPLTANAPGFGAAAATPTFGAAQPFGAAPALPAATPYAATSPATAPYGAAPYAGSAGSFPTPPMTGALPANPFGATSPAASPWPPATAPGLPVQGVPAAPSTYAPAPPAANNPYSGMRPPTPQPLAARAPGTVVAGDRIIAPQDSGPLRFEPQGPWGGTSIGGRTPPAPQVAAATPRTASDLPATARGWISGSAPVRTQLAANDARVRVPSGGVAVREAVSVAALSGSPQTGRVQITPLDGGATGGGQSPETMGWR
ncbi:MAG: hypothetical protein ACRCT8_05285 [Lacipirellulaceae bacterium]